ncbi:MAG: proline--tRNA ligase [Zetaproteobacteria bacterium]|nr:MAG: proline--tRNA ligase [Zetaproteobacteria bacterium]
MGKKHRTAIIPTRAEDFPEWYQQVIKAADMAENSPVRGCMIIKPYGFALWEKMQSVFDGWLKDYGVQNASFPLLIPLSFLEKEAEHIEGFAKECAVVTHHRLEVGEDGLVPAGKLEEPYVIRPTSETIIGDAMSRWIQSYRDLPMKLNQWSNVMRWEMRTRLFLRTSEFFWHEGHNAFETPEEAKEDCLTILGMYEKFFEEYLAFSGYTGIKTPDERFPGALETYAFEAVMQDGKALQAATTHDLGQTFSRSCNITFQGREGAEQFAHTTSWAFSTRVIGGMIMIHGDDDGMMMPPRIAPQQVIILPFIKDASTEDKIFDFAQKLANKLKAQGMRVHIDKRDMRSSDKMWDAVKKGVPVRVEIGGREVEKGEVTFVRRDIGRDSKETMSVDGFLKKLPTVLDDIHDAMLARSKAFRDEHTIDSETVADIDGFFANDRIGLVKVPISVLEDATLEAVMKKYSLSTRCMPFADKGEKVLIGKAY